jgi:hypothetical protein
MAAIGDGNPRIALTIPITTPATNATVIWLPTKAPIRATIPFVSALILGRREAGAKRSPCSITSGSEMVKYIVKTKMVKDVNTPEIKVFPTPTIPPNAEIIKVPSLEIDLSLEFKESINP